MIGLLLVFGAFILSRYFGGAAGSGSDAAVEMPVCVTSDAQRPTRAHDSDAGLDLSSATAAVVPARGRAVIPTGVRLALPEGTYGQVASRSGLSARHGIEVGAGVIDAGFTGEVSVVLHNHSDKDFEVAAGDRVAQLLVLPVVMVRPTAVCGAEWADVATGSVRGDGGFGSSGLRPGDAGPE